MLSLPIKAIRIVIHRLRTQGLRTTLLWLYARGIPKLTGVPLLRFSAITPQIAVGPQYGRRGKRHLEANGYTGSVNLRAEFDDAAHGLALAAYCHLPTVDDAAISLDHLERGVAFIRDVVERGGKVYIHCAGGVGARPPWPPPISSIRAWRSTRHWRSSGGRGLSSTSCRRKWPACASSRRSASASRTRHSNAFLKRSPFITDQSLV